MYWLISFIPYFLLSERWFKNHLLYTNVCFVEAKWPWNTLLKSFSESLQSFKTMRCFLHKYRLITQKWFILIYWLIHSLLDSFICGHHTKEMLFKHLQKKSIYSIITSFSFWWNFFIFSSRFLFHMALLNYHKQFSNPLYIIM